MGFLKTVKLGMDLKVLRIIKVTNVLHFIDTATLPFLKPVVSDVSEACSCTPCTGTAVHSVEVSIFIKC